MRKVALICCVALPLLGAGCSSGSGGSSSCTAANATDLTAQDPFEIDIQSFAYHPSCFEVKSSQSIKIVNNDSAPHTFTISGTSVDVKIDAGKTVEGGSAGLSPGTYPFHCTIHPQMTGTVIVE